MKKNINSPQLNGRPLVVVALSMIILAVLVPMGPVKAQDDRTVCVALSVSASDLIGKSGVLVIEAPPKHLVIFSQNGLDASTTGKVVTVNRSAITYADLPYTMLVDNGTSINYSYEANVSSSDSGKRYRLDTVSGQPSTIIVESPLNITGNYVTQYYLTVTSGYDTPSGQGWYDDGSTAYATLANGDVSGLVSPFAGENEMPPEFIMHKIRHVFTGWSEDASGTGLTSDAITMNRPKTAAANWKTEYHLTGSSAQYYITVTSAYGSPTPSALVNASDTFTVSVTSSTVLVGPVSRWVCTGFSVDGDAYQTGTNYTFTDVQSEHSVDFAWKEQLWIVFELTGVLKGLTAHVTVNSVQHTLPYSDWFDKGSSIDFDYEDVVFGADNTKSILTFKSEESPLTVEKSVTVIGYYETQYASETNEYQYTPEMIVVISAIIIIAGLTIATVLLKRGKTKEVKIRP
jgi:hypothetical protein